MRCKKERAALREPDNEVAILNTVFTVKHWARFVTSPDEKASGFSVRQKFPLWRADSKNRGFKNVRISVDGALANICRSRGTLGARDFSYAISGQFGLRPTPNHPGAEKNL